METAIDEVFAELQCKPGHDPVLGLQHFAKRTSNRLVSQEIDDFTRIGKALELFLGEDQLAVGDHLKDAAVPFDQF